MVDTFNVLSIDWDYFIDATAGERCMLFPDGGNENLSLAIANLIWSTRYANPALAKVEVDKPELEKLMRALELASTPVAVVVDSHKHLYDMIKRFNPKRKPLNIVNIDFHHDCYGTDEKEAVDCGNWALKALQPGDACLTDFPEESSYVWVSRKDSDLQDYEEFEYPWATRVVGIDKAPSLGEDWDIIFLCRSGVWSPPHADPEFAKVIDQVYTVATDVIWESSIEVSRYDADMVEAAEQHRQMTEQLRKGVYNG